MFFRKCWTFSGSFLFYFSSRYWIEVRTVFNVKTTTCIATHTSYTICFVSRVELYSYYYTTMHASPPTASSVQSPAILSGTPFTVSISKVLSDIDALP